MCTYRPSVGFRNPWYCNGTNNSKTALTCPVSYSNALIKAVLRFYNHFWESFTSIPGIGKKKNVLVTKAIKDMGGRAIKPSVVSSRCCPTFVQKSGSSH